MTEKGTKAPRRSSRKKSGGEDEAKAEAPRAERSAASRSRGAKAVAAPEVEGVPEAERPGWVAVAAYYHAERRGFAPGYELDDWLAAEAELEAAPPAAPGRASKPRKPAASRHTSAR
jgi:hypothetical protein